MGGRSKDTAEYLDDWGIPSALTRRPAIGIISSDADFESIARTLIRAKRHGYFTFIAVSNTTDPTITALARELGAGVLEFETSEVERAQIGIENVARSLGFAGVLYHVATNRRIDFSQCDVAFETSNQYGTYAPVVSDVEEGDAEVAVAIPAYNEEATVGDIVTRVTKHVDDVIVVDDGSSDDTATVAERAGATVIEHGRNRGYGAALQTAFTEAARRGVERFVVLDGDGQHDPEDVPRLLRELRESDADIVIGSRFHDDDDFHVPFYRRFGLWIINVLTNLSLGTVRPRSWISDTQSGFRAYSGKAVQSLATDRTLGNGMSASTDILYHANDSGYEIDEIGTAIRYDGDGTSTQSPVQHGLELVGNILKTVKRKRPLLFLGVPGFVVVLMGGGFGYWSVVNYLDSGSIPVGLAVLCLLSTFFGTVLTITAVVLHSMQTFVDTLSDRGPNRW